MTIIITLKPKEPLSNNQYKKLLRELRKMKKNIAYDESFISKISEQLGIGKRKKSILCDKKYKKLLTTKKIKCEQDGGFKFDFFGFIRGLFKSNHATVTPVIDNNQNYIQNVNQHRVPLTFNRIIRMNSEELAQINLDRAIIDENDQVPVLQTAILIENGYGNQIQNLTRADISNLYNDIHTPRNRVVSITRVRNNQSPTIAVPMETVEITLPVIINGKMENKVITYINPDGKFGIGERIKTPTPKSSSSASPIASRTRSKTKTT
jgi:hypothetical protein